ncbi:MAG: peptidyl-tRNA hydrolase [Candidatus Binatia bacterium]|nr:MAG: peptidyl-tRNA hydrolase [Candidatus Binatia bacterium]
MWTVIGLGNPGREYEGTRHNVGFEVVELLARRHAARWDRPRKGCRCASFGRGEKRVLLVEPLRYMNRSGEALSELFGADLPELSRTIVVHDDLDLELGRVRVKRAGGAAGHHGVESVAGFLGPDFVRVRVGVGRPEPGQDVVGFLLSPFEADERQVISESLDRAADAVEAIVDLGLEAAMNLYNRRTPASAPEEARAAREEKR